VHSRGHCGKALVRLGVEWPVRLSVTKSRRRWRSALRSVLREVRLVCQLSHCLWFSVAEGASSRPGNAVRMVQRAAFIQRGSTSLVQLRVPRTQTAPVSGKKSVSLPSRWHYTSSRGGCQPTLAQRWRASTIRG
jgi:hypothetical protein